MEQETSTTTETPIPPDAGRELTRSVGDRVLGGVAAGIADRTGIPKWLVRAIFIVFSFAGGLGMAVYAAGWVLIRSEDERETIAQRFFERTTSTGSWLGVGLIFIALLVLLDNVRFLSGGVIWSVGLLTIGLLLYTGDLPRLIRDSDDDKEGVQQMTTTRETPTTSEPVEGIVGGGDNVTTPPPPPPTPTPPILPSSPPKPRSILGRATFGVMAIALALLAVFDNTTSLVSPEPRHYMALAVTVLGVGLIVGAFAGRARWLILIGLMSLPFLFGSPALEYNFDDWQTGTVFVAPDSSADVPTTFSQGVGEVVIDLTRFEWNGEDLSLKAELDIGELRVIVPEGVAVTGTGHASVGNVEFNGERSSGFNPALVLGSSGEDGTLELAALVRIGNLEIDHVPVNG